MLTRSLRISLVASISLFRVLAALVFSLIAFTSLHNFVIATLYFLAMASDVLDGYAARKLSAETYFGKVLDLVGDKSLTIISLLYAAQRGISLLPLAMIGTREIVMIGARMIIVEGTQLLPTNRVLGGLMWLLLWGNTLFLVLVPNGSKFIASANLIYWVCALVFFANFLARVRASAYRIRLSLDNTNCESQHAPTDEPLKRARVATPAR
ncbi:MAG: CDP-alcohol phosphatidyltransferase [Pyrinomonadaceae bacterium]|nr:CDP-alcohol phosphatidyltransferase [Pyrinomonadaceae bacterium]